MNIILSTAEVSQLTGIPRAKLHYLRKKHELAGVEMIKVDDKPGRPSFMWAGRAIRDILDILRQEGKEDSVGGVEEALTAYQKSVEKQASKLRSAA